MKPRINCVHETVTRDAVFYTVCICIFFFMKTKKMKGKKRSVREVVTLDLHLIALPLQMNSVTTLGTCVRVSAP